MSLFYIYKLQNKILPYVHVIKLLLDRADWIAEIQLVHAKAEAQILWPPDRKSWLIRRAPDAVKYWRQEEKGMINDKMVGWQHWLNGHKFEQTPGGCERQGSLACCGPWGGRVGQDWATEEQQQ